MRLLASGLVHSIASDAHDAKRRRPGFQAAFGEIEATLRGAADGARWFVEYVPRAICEGSDLPGRPPELAHPPSGWRRIKRTVGLP